MHRAKLPIFQVQHSGHRLLLDKIEVSLLKKLRLCSKIGKFKHRMPTVFSGAANYNRKNLQ